jgi:glycosyltransferase involved in cell wall biosynthesis
MNVDTRFSVRDKVLVLRLTRLGRIPPALSATEILVEEGFPVLVVEYGNIAEPKKRVDAKIPRLRLAWRWLAIFPRPLRPTLIFLAALARLGFACLTQGRPRLCIAHGLSEQTLAFCLHRVFGIPYVVHVHEVYDKNEVKGLNRFFLAVEGFCLRRAVFLLFPGAGRAELYRKRYRLEVPCEIVANCPRRRPAPGPNDPRAVLREALGVAPGAMVMGYFGGLGHYNALPDAIRAVARIPKLVFVLWGWGEKAYTDALRELARGVGAGDRVFFPGELPADKWGTLEGLDLGYCVYEPRLLRLRYAATASNKLMECLAAGVPVVTNRMEDFVEILDTCDVGVALPELSVAALAETLRTLCQDRLGLKRRSENGRRWHEERYHFENQFAGALTRFRLLVPQEAASRRRESVPGIR